MIHKVVEADRGNDHAAYANLYMTVMHNVGPLGKDEISEYNKKHKIQFSYISEAFDPKDFDQELFLDGYKRLKNLK